jgi:predicted AlkP superfamily phosphohydrolase/phosphomutase
MATATIEVNMFPTLLIGLDGATFSVLDPFMEDGTMPFLRNFASNGARGVLLSTPNPQTAQAWPSLMTGRSPGNHGVFDFVRFQERTGGPYMTVTNSRDLCCETIWSIASREDRTVTALNFYGMWPPKPVAGSTISGFVTWRGLRSAIYPPSLYSELMNLPDFNRKELAMDLDAEKKCIQGLQNELYEQWILLHTRREQRWFEVLRYLKQNHPTDLTALVFDGVDKLQHLCWRFIDPALSRKLTSAWEKQIHELCLHYFRQLDEFIADLVTSADRDTRTFIVSDHGFGSTTEIFYLNVWLHKKGYLEWTDQAPLDDHESLTSERLKSHVALIDWRRTSAYALTPSSNGIFIRREALGDGTEEEYLQFRQQLMEALLAFRDPATDEPVVTRIRTREEAYTGKMMHTAPDLLLTLRDGGFVSILNSDTPVKPRSEPSGTHRPEGIFMAAGPGIAQCSNLPSLSILDVAPALLYSLDVPVPEDMEGAVPYAVFTSEFLAAHPIRLGKSGSSEPEDSGEPFSLGPAAEEQLLDRLRALGYLE